MIHIDWKQPGGDYLEFFAEHYPDLEFLRSDEFAELVDELANESPEQCFDRLSPFLAAHQYELWDVDCGGDDYLLFLVASNATEAFQAEWADVGRPKRVGFSTGTVSAPEKPNKPKATKAKLPPIVEDSDYHLAYGGLRSDATITTYAEWMEEDDNRVHGLLDTRTFPLRIIDATGFLALKESSEGLWPAYGHSETQYWWLTPKGKGRRKKKHSAVWTEEERRLIVFSDYEAGAFSEVPGYAFESNAYPYAYGSTMYFLQRNLESKAARDVPQIDQNGVLTIAVPPHHEDPSYYADPENGGVSEPERCLFSVVRNGHHSLVADVRGHGTVIPLSESEAALVFGDELIDEPNRRAVAVIDVDSNTYTNNLRLPTNGISFFRINHSEVGYVHGVVSPHPESADFEQRAPYLIRFNVHTGESRQASIDGMCDNYKHKHRKYTKYPEFEEVTYKFRTFDGGIDASAGHDNWIVLNYLTTAYGTHDLAWIWNVDTDEVVRIPMSDFPRESPRLHFVEELGRYVADGSCQFDLLIAFAEIYATRPRTTLTWTPVPTDG